MAENNQLEIYQGPKGDIVFNIDASSETIWASIDQIAKLFETTRRNIELHLKNIFSDMELDENRTAKDSFVVRLEGNRQVKRRIRLYNLDAIISVGYRVNSRKATGFRIWATKVLKEYTTNGIAINERRLKELDSKKLKEVEGMMGVVRRLMARQELDAGEARGILEVITSYTTSFKALEEYDDGHISLKNLNKKTKKILTPEICETAIADLKKTLKAGELFGKRRNDSFYGSLNNIYQSFDGEDLYKSTPEKAANLLYFIIKDHPFYDGNKRIGSLLFIIFLTINNCHLTKDGTTKISDRAMTAIALLIAESNPNEKSLIVSLVQKLLED
ncbi:virulence protein RhuM/Fic/DOC family protein [Candidatus Saccharibacteria bacterium]|nr:virulence protein RhuM/Fic/DOC family protein [Candidatus Saccharibacteria bacterium]